MPEVERIARIIARKLGHNDDAGMEWERYVVAARGILAEPPKLSADKIAMVLAETVEADGDTISNVSFVAVKLAGMAERGELRHAD